MIKAVLFDMDGVLVDAKSWHYQALNRALAQHGYEISLEEHLEHYDGLPTSKKLALMSQRLGLAPELHTPINELKQRYTRELINELCRPNQEHCELLARLRSDGYRTALASNSIADSVQLMMSLTGLNQYLELMLSTSDVTHPKPDPEIYTKAITYFDLNPDECLVVEDNRNGIDAALAAGAHVLEVVGVSDVTISNIYTTIAALNKGQTNGKI